MTSPIYTVASASTRGQAHVERGAPNQDCAAAVAEDGLHLLVVSDGHGAPVHARSADGARFAVESFIAEAHAMVSLVRAASPGHMREALGTAFRRVRELWLDKVDADLADRPLPDELDRALSAQGLDRSGAYGATLIAAALWPGGGALWQLGDGDLFVLRSNGIAKPLPEDRRPGQETASLCLGDALEAVRAAAIDDVDAVVLATDGFAKAFANAGEVEHAALGFVRVARQGGDLDAAIAPMASAGLRDDVSVAIAVRGAPPVRATANGARRRSTKVRRAAVWVGLGLAVLSAALMVLNTPRRSPPPARERPADNIPGGTPLAPRPVEGESSSPRAAASPGDGANVATGGGNAGPEGRR